MRSEIQEQVYFKFGDFQLRPEMRSLLNLDEPVHLAKRPFDILLHLAENRDRVVTRDELIEKFWDGHEVYDDALRKTISTIRHALNDTSPPWRYIGTVRGSGFRFVAEIKETHTGTSPTALVDHRQIPRRVGSRAVLLVTLFLIVILSASFAVNRYLGGNVKSSARSKPSVTAIAVLPIRNLTGDSGNDYLSDGISEGLISEISRNSTLKVISRSSSFSFRNSDANPSEIASKLGVDGIVEGSLKKAGNDLRLDVTLVSGTNGEVLWTNDSAKNLIANVFNLQSEIACRLLVSVDAGRCSQTETPKNVDPEAYRLYLKAVQMRKDLSAEGLRKAAEIYIDSIRIDPDFAATHEALATVYLIMESNSAVPPGSVIQKAEEQANEALRLDESSVDALLVLSETKTAKNYDLQMREMLLRQAVERNPNHVRARMWLANTLTVRAKFAEAESQLLVAQQLDPLSQGVRINLFELYQYWRRPEKAAEQADLLLSLDPDNTSGLWMNAKLLLDAGETTKAKELWDRLPESDRIDTEIEFILRNVHGDEARRAVDKLSRTDKGKTSPFFIGCAYARINDRDDAFVWFERAYTMRQSDLVSLKIDPALDLVRDDPRYFDLLRRMHLDQ
ncbi:MAG: winged helix-turn-helix domain-containing protein [Pyrinomonadaceae bacterium]